MSKFNEQEQAALDFIVEKAAEVWLCIGNKELSVEKFLDDDVMQGIVFGWALRSTSFGELEDIIDTSPYINNEELSNLVEARIKEIENAE